MSLHAGFHSSSNIPTRRESILPTMKLTPHNMVLPISGLGIIFYSPRSVEHIPPGSNYLRSNYLKSDQVLAHNQKGTIVGFSTGSPGTYHLRFHEGDPNDRSLEVATYKLRLGLHCTDGAVCFRDLYDLINWRRDCPRKQMVSLDDGFYEVTLCSSLPASGIIGDDQVIDFHLNRTSELPKLTKSGMPVLCG